MRFYLNNLIPSFNFQRATYSISINRLIAEGNCLEKGEELHSYLSEDPKGRKIMITYLDGKKREK